MARTILGEYGPDAVKPQAPRITKNGPAADRDVMDYQPPQGPKYTMNTGVGLRGGTNFGNAGSQGKSVITAEGSGYPGQGVDHILSDGFDSDDSGPEPGDPIREDD